MDISFRKKVMVQEKTNGHCFYCGSTKNLHIDHFVSKKKWKEWLLDRYEGSVNKIENLFLACAHCNCSKSDKCPEDFIGNTWVALSRYERANKRIKQKNMANHRMFSNRIANSAKFLQMPAESQLLYFHMVLRADDDGVVEAYPLTKLLGSPPDVIKVLIAKDFIKQLNEDQVIIISDWLEHNTIRPDRKVNSIYKHLIPEEIPLIEPKPRSDVKDNSRRTDNGQSTVSVSKDKLSQAKISEVMLEEETPSQKTKKFFSNLEGEQEKIINMLIEKGVPKNIATQEINKFISYWTEPTKSGKNQKWEKQETFEIMRRLATWFRNFDSYNKNSSNNKHGVSMQIDI